MDIVKSLQTGKIQQERQIPRDEMLERISQMKSSNSFLTSNNLVLKEKKINFGKFIWLAKA